ncbi:MAG: hypothetical protein ACF8R9_15125 [Phycisphaerales bacterium JB054]
MIRFRAASAKDLITKAEEAPTGMESVDLYRRAGVMADRQDDLDSAFAARRELVNAAYYAEARLDQLFAFVYCLALAEKHPSRFSAEDLMWQYKWIVEAMIDFTPVPLTLVDRLLEDMSERYRRHSLGTAAIDQLRLGLCVKTGQKDRLRDAYETWDRNTDRAGSDCNACQLHDRVRFRIAAGEDEKALEEAEPLLSGKMRCADVPHSTFGLLQLPLLRLGRHRQAANLFLRGYDMIKSRQGFVRTVGEYLVFLAVAGDAERGLGLVQMHLKEGLRSHSDLVRITLARGAWAVCERARLDGQTVVSLSLPPRFAGYQRDSVYDLAALGRHFRQDLDDRTAAFDQRNGNHVQREATMEVEAMLGQGLHIPL